jgi:hypothetical protein
VDQGLDPLIDIATRSLRRNIRTEAGTKSPELTLSNRRETLLRSSTGSISRLADDDDDSDDVYDTKSANNPTSSNSRDPDVALVVNLSPDYKKRP